MVKATVKATVKDTVKARVKDTVKARVKARVKAMALTLASPSIVTHGLTLTPDSLALTAERCCRYRLMQ